MKIAIMQPYFLPYIGYFQLVNAVDVFVIYDNIQYTKKGWINRNRYLQNNTEAYFTIPLEKASDYLNVMERRISDSFNKKKTVNQIYNAYKKAPYFNSVYPLFSEIINHDNSNLFEYIYKSFLAIKSILAINTKIVVSSTIPIDTKLTSSEKVLEICRYLNATTYINPIGGVNLYSQKEFMKNKIELYFLKSHNVEYTQFGNNFIPWLSILDVLMFNSNEEVIDLVTNEFTLV